MIVKGNHGGCAFQCRLTLRHPDAAGSEGNPAGSVDFVDLPIVNSSYGRTKKLFQAFTSEVYKTPGQRNHYLNTLMQTLRFQT
jgi:hypothetical protein